MSEESTYKLSKEQLLEMRAVDGELRAARAELIAMQQAFPKIEQAHKEFHEKLTADITENGQWDLVGNVDPETREVKRKLSEQGKKTRAGVAKIKAVEANGAANLSTADVVVADEDSAS